MMNPEQPEASPGRIIELDGLRGIAVALVVVWHYLPCQVDAGAGLWASVIRRVLYLTGSGVDLFFVLSGFLIVGILLDQRTARNCLRVFYLRRACRILPLYFLLLATFVILRGALTFPATSEEWMFGGSIPFWSYASFTQNILMGLRDSFGAGILAVTWSLAVEEQFYLLIPPLVMLAGRKGLMWLLPLLFLAAPLLRIASPGFHAYVNTPWRADPLLAGAFLAVLLKSDRCVLWIRRHVRFLLAAGALLAAGIPAMIFWPGCLGVFSGTWLALGYSLLLLCAVLCKHPWITGILGNRLLVWIGIYSYGIYMFHQLASGLLHGMIRQQAPRIASLTDAGVTLLALFATLALAWLSFIFFESPILRFGHRFKYRHAPNGGN